MIKHFVAGKWKYSPARPMIIIRKNQGVHEGKEPISSNYLKTEATLDARPVDSKFKLLV